MHPEPAENLCDLLIFVEDARRPRNHLSVIEFWRGERIPVRMTSIPAEVNTASNAAPKEASRSWIRNRARTPASPMSISRFRACCDTQPAVGWNVVFRMAIFDSPSRSAFVPKSSTATAPSRLVDPRLEGGVVVLSHEEPLVSSIVKAKR